MSEPVRFSISIARVDSAGAKLMNIAPDWPTDAKAYDLMPYVEHRPHRLVALRKLVGINLETIAGRLDEPIEGPCLEAVVEHGDGEVRLRGRLPALKTNKHGERIRSDMDMIIVFRTASPDLGKPAIAALVAQGVEIASVAL